MSQTSCNAISHPALQQFWADKVGRDETDWDSFWATFKQLPGIADSIKTEADRACFQAAVHVNGDPKRVSAAAMDMAFPPGLSLEANVYRLKEEQKTEQQPTNVANLLLSLEAHGFPHCSLTLNPIHTEAMQSIIAELSDKDSSARVAHIYGSAYINPARLATHAALAMRQRGSWTTAVYCSLQGVTAAEQAAARLASSLRILSYPVITNELLRISTHFHAKTHVSTAGVVLDMEACPTSQSQPSFLPRLMHQITQVGGRRVQVIVAGSLCRDLPDTDLCFSIAVPPFPSIGRIEQLVKDALSDRRYSNAGKGVVPAFHGVALLDLVLTNVGLGFVKPKEMMKLFRDPVVQEGSTKKLAADVIEAVLTSFPPEETKYLYRLSVMQSSFSLSNAQRVLSSKTMEGCQDVLDLFVERSFLQYNAVQQRYTMPAFIQSCLFKLAVQNDTASVKASMAGLASFCMQHIEDAAYLNATCAQTMAMRLLDRERALLDRFVSLLENTEMIPGTALSLYAEVVSKHMELLAFRLTSQQQELLCATLAKISVQEGDALGEARALQYLPTAGEDTALKLTEGIVQLKRAFGPRHPFMAEILLARARILMQSGVYAQAKHLFEESALIQKETDPHSLILGTILTELAGACHAISDHVQAKLYLQQAVQFSLTKLGADHPDTALSKCRLAACKADLQDYKGAHDLYLEAMLVWLDRLGHCHPHLAVLMGQIGFCCTKLGNVDEAIRNYRRGINMWKQMLLFDQPEVREDLRALASLYSKTGDFGGAAALQNRMVMLESAVRSTQVVLPARGPPLTTERQIRKRILRPLKKLFGPRCKKEMNPLTASFCDADQVLFPEVDSPRAEPQTEEIIEVMPLQSVSQEQLALQLTPGLPTSDVASLHCEASSSCSTSEQEAISEVVKAASNSEYGTGTEGASLSQPWSKSETPESTENVAASRQCSSLPLMISIPPEEDFDYELLPDSSDDAESLQLPAAALPQPPGQELKLPLEPAETEREGTTLVYEGNEQPSDYLQMGKSLSGRPPRRPMETTANESPSPTATDLIRNVWKGLRPGRGPRVSDPGSEETGEQPPPYMRAPPLKSVLHLISSRHTSPSSSPGRPKSASTVKSASPQWRAAGDRPAFGSNGRGPSAGVGGRFESGVVPSAGGNAAGAWASSLRSSSSSSSGSKGIRRQSTSSVYSEKPQNPESSNRRKSEGLAVKQAGKESLQSQGKEKTMAHLRLNSYSPRLTDDLIKAHQIKGYFARNSNMSDEATSVASDDTLPSLTEEDVWKLQTAVLDAKAKLASRAVSLVPQVSGDDQAFSPLFDGLQSESPTS